MKKFLILIVAVLMPVLALAQAQINTKKTKISCITVNVDKLEICPESERERILNRLEEINKEMSRLDNEMELLKSEAFTLEMKIMMGEE